MASIAHTPPPPLPQSEVRLMKVLYVRYSFLLISNEFCDWRGGGECDEKNLLHFAPSLSHRAKLWALEAHVHKTTYELLIDTALYIILLMQANPLLWQLGREWALEILIILGPEWHSPNSLMPFHISLSPKKARFPEPNSLPLALVMDLSASKALRTWLYTS
jgi:hypothetical protein